MGTRDPEQSGCPNRLFADLRTLPGVPALIIQNSEEGRHLQKRFYILFVARGDDGQLRKISIPSPLFVCIRSRRGHRIPQPHRYRQLLHPHALKVSRYNELRTEKEQLKDRYSRWKKSPKSATFKSLPWARLPARSRLFTD
jgi:hypothetical protein